MAEPLRIAVVGAGRAGSVRVRDLDGHPRARLAALVRREGEPTLADVLADPGIDAVLVCTPNLDHHDMARAALEAGKHVAVEFPLAARAADARELFERAREVERVLHVEHIELLSPAQVAQRKRARELGRPRHGELRFTGSSAGWLGEEARAGSAALRALARLHRLVDLFGEAEVRAAEQSATDSGYRLRVELGFRAGGRVQLVEERGADLERATHWQVRCERGMLDDPDAGSAAGAFRQDLDCFVARVREGAPSYVSEQRILSLLGLVEEIERRASG